MLVWLPREADVPGSQQLRTEPALGPRATQAAEAARSPLALHWGQDAASPFQQKRVPGLPRTPCQLAPLPPGPKAGS